MSKKTKNTIATIAIMLILVGTLLYFVHYTSWSKEVSYELQNIDDDGNYAIYHTVSSSIPADNYEVAYVCFNDAMHTLEGNVSITYTNDNPHIDITWTHLVYGNDYNLYVPLDLTIFKDTGFQYNKQYNHRN